MKCQECKAELTEEEERVEELRELELCVSCYRYTIEFLVFLKTESRNR